MVGRTAKLTFSEDPVQSLCIIHALDRPIDYWLDFMKLFEKLGMNPVDRLRERIVEWIQLSFRSTQYSLALRRSDAGLLPRSSARPAAVKAQTCRSPGCENAPVTDGGLCLACSLASGSRRYWYPSASSTTMKSRRELARQTKGCLLRDCLEFNASSDEVCDRCRLKLNEDMTSDAHTKTRNSGTWTSAQCYSS